jgi:hypothetical protein
VATRLADLQQRTRDAVVSGNTTLLAPVLVGGEAPARRLAIHARHYSASLVSALMRRFPATGWLLGTPLIEEAARHFVRKYPPSAPCVAEYGEGFAHFLATWPGAERVAYLREFADLDWHLGRLAVSVDRPAIMRSDCAAMAPSELADAIVGMQPGTHYSLSAWPIDELMTMYLTHTAPNQLSLLATEVWIEARGARGSLRLSRLTAAEFSFRVALFEGLPLEAAAERAMRSDEAFDPGAALVALVDAGLVTSIARVPCAERS